MTSSVLEQSTPGWWAQSTPGELQGCFTLPTGKILLSSNFLFGDIQVLFRDVITWGGGIRAVIELFHFAFKPAFWGRFLNALLSVGYNREGEGEWQIYGVFLGVSVDSCGLRNFLLSLMFCFISEHCSC